MSDTPGPPTAVADETENWPRRIEVGIALLTGVAGIVALGFTAQSLGQTAEQLSVSQKEVSNAEQGQITDRYTAAVEILGDDAMQVRLGGIYALQRIMEDSPRDQPSIVNVLSAYIRTRATISEEKQSATAQSAPDVQAALSVLTERGPSRDGGANLDLRQAGLKGASFPQSAFPVKKNAIAQLGGANLSGTDLRGVWLSGADLRTAYAEHVNLAGAHLDQANLQDIELRDSAMSKTSLVYANLHEAGLVGADLRDTRVTMANLTNAWLIDADLRDAGMIGANLSNTYLYGADLRGSDVTVEQVVSAWPDATTRLPPKVAKDPRVVRRIAESEARNAKPSGDR
ncbi:pentapeptide repeat-containing protein [Streptomyces sp. NPDC058470]|uniref:pentapeptide repeat-containing protein n=1 Tax=Streptomyces sp. NPDC058470 TaxID=3346515 RepID=UPI00365EE190